MNTIRRRGLANCFGAVLMSLLLMSCGGLAVPPPVPATDNPQGGSGPPVQAPDDSSRIRGQVTQNDGNTITVLGFQIRPDDTSVLADIGIGDMVIAHVTPPSPSQVWHASKVEVVAQVSPGLLIPLEIVTAAAPLMYVDADQAFMTDDATVVTRPHEIRSGNTITWEGLEQVPIATFLADPAALIGPEYGPVMCGMVMLAIALAANPDGSYSVQSIDYQIDWC